MPRARGVAERRRNGAMIHLGPVMRHPFLELSEASRCHCAVATMTMTRTQSQVNCLSATTRTLPPSLRLRQCVDIQSPSARGSSKYFGRAQKNIGQCRCRYLPRKQTARCVASVSAAVYSTAQDLEMRPRRTTTTVSPRLLPSPSTARA